MSQHYLVFDFDSIIFTRTHNVTNQIEGPCQHSTILYLTQLCSANRWHSTTIVAALSLAGYVGDMLATCRQRVGMSPILDKYGMLRQHKNVTDKRILCRKPPTFLQYRVRTYLINFGVHPFLLAELKCYVKNHIF
jgi:hypothetical protein